MLNYISSLSKIIDVLFFQKVYLKFIWLQYRTKLKFVVISIVISIFQFSIMINDHDKVNIMEMTTVQKVNAKINVVKIYKEYSLMCKI